MTFKHVGSFEERLPTLQQKIISGKRYYVTPENNAYPSVTTVISVLSIQRINEWKKQVGEDVANAEAKRAAIRGISFHSICEDYLRNQDLSEHENKVLPMALFSLAKKQLDRINNVFAQETCLFSDSLCLAGRTDCIAEFSGILSVIDFKTSTRKKREDWMESYYLQETAYSLMWEEMTGMPIGRIVTLIACEDGTMQTLVQRRDKFVSKLQDCIERYASMVNDVYQPKVRNKQQRKKRRGYKP